MGFAKTGRFKMKIAVKIILICLFKNIIFGQIPEIKPTSRLSFQSTEVNGTDFNQIVPMPPNGLPNLRQ